MKCSLTITIGMNRYLTLSKDEVDIKFLKIFRYLICKSESICYIRPKHWELQSLSS